MEANRLKKTLAILLVVLFLVTVTAGAVSAVKGNGTKNLADPTTKLSSKISPMGPTPFPSIAPYEIKKVIGEY